MSVIPKSKLNNEIGKGRLADFANCICQMFATDLDDNWRAFYLSGFDTPDYEKLTYTFNTDYNEVFKIVFDFNNFSITVSRSLEDGFIDYKVYDLGLYLASL